MSESVRNCHFMISYHTSAYLHILKRIYMEDVFAASMLWPESGFIAWTFHNLYATRLAIAFFSLIVVEGGGQSDQTIRWSCYNLSLTCFQESQERAPSCRFSNPSSSHWKPHLATRLSLLVALLELILAAILEHGHVQIYTYASGMASQQKLAILVWTEYHD